MTALEGSGGPATALEGGGQPTVAPEGVRLVMFSPPDLEGAGDRGDSNLVCNAAIAFWFPNNIVRKY